MTTTIKLRNISRDVAFLRDCVTALKEYDNPTGFNMRYVETCVVGHYCYWKTGGRSRANPEWIMMASMCLHGVGTTLACKELVDLFGFQGCGNAQTKQEAIVYIEAVIAHKEAYIQRVERRNRVRTIFERAARVFTGDVYPVQEAV